MNDLWLVLTRRLLVPPPVVGVPKFSAMTLPTPARLIPGAQMHWNDAVGKFNGDVERFAADLSDRVFAAGVFGGGVVYGGIAFVLGIALGWWFCRQTQRMVTEYHASKP